MLALVVASTFWSMVAYAGPLGNAVTLSAALDASAAGTTWVLASMSVGLAVTLLAAGVVADALGRARVFALGAMVFAGANLVCAVVGSTWPFVVARVVVGLGAAGMIATGLGLLAAADGDGRHRSTSAVWWSAAMGAGIALGPLLTGVLDLAGAWRWFYVGLALAGTLLYALAGRVLPVEPPAERARRLDLVGFTLLTAFLALLVTAIVQVRAGGPMLAAVLLGGSVLLLVALGLYGMLARRNAVLVLVGAELVLAGGSLRICSSVARRDCADAAVFAGDARGADGRGARAPPRADPHCARQAQGTVVYYTTAIAGWRRC